MPTINHYTRRPSVIHFDWFCTVNRLVHTTWCWLNAPPRGLVGRAKQFHSPSLTMGNWSGTGLSLKWSPSLSQDVLDIPR
jgi:hypothetical protein